MGGGHRDLTAADSPNWANSRPRVALRLRFGKATLMDGSAPPVPTQHAALTRAGRRRPVSVTVSELGIFKFRSPAAAFPLRAALPAWRGPGIPSLCRCGPTGSADTWRGASLGPGGCLTVTPTLTVTRTEKVPGAILAWE